MSTKVLKLQSHGLCVCCNKHYTGSAVTMRCVLKCNSISRAAALFLGLPKIAMQTYLILK